MFPEFLRLSSLNLVREIFTLPEIYSAIGDDFSPPVEQFKPNPHPQIWYLAAHHANQLIGMFILMPQNRICWDAHVVMLPWSDRDSKWGAARALPAYLAAHTECKRLTAAIPASNRRVLYYATHGVGMRYVGRQEKAFLKCGELQDLILLGRPIGE